MLVLVRGQGTRVTEMRKNSGRQSWWQANGNKQAKEVFSLLLVPTSFFPLDCGTSVPILLLEIGNNFLFRWKANSWYVCIMSPGEPDIILKVRSLMTCRALLLGRNKMLGKMVLTWCISTRGPKQTMPFSGCCQIKCRHVWSPQSYEDDHCIGWQLLKVASLFRRGSKLELCAALWVSFCKGLWCLEIPLVSCS